MTPHLSEREPLLYVVAYDSDDEPDESYSPIVMESQLEASGATLPHLLSSEMKPALDALWYCLHLPRDPTDFMALPVSSLDAGRRAPMGHNLLLMPISFVRQFFAGVGAPWPRTLLIGPAAQREQLVQISDSLLFALPPLFFDELSNESLRTQWSTLKDSLGFESVPTHEIDLELTPLGVGSPIMLPFKRLARQMGLDDAHESGELTRSALVGYQLQAAFTELESEGVSPSELDDRMPETMARVSRTLRLPLVLGLPGQSSRHYSRYGATATGPQALADSRSELSAITLMVTKEAVARDSWGAVIGPCPPSAFSALAQLEAHSSGGANPAGVANIRRRLDKALAPCGQRI